MSFISKCIHFRLEPKNPTYTWRQDIISLDQIIYSFCTVIQNTELDMPVELAASARPFSYLIPTVVIFSIYTHMQMNTPASKGASKRPLPVRRKKVLKSGLWKNSQLLYTWSYTIVREWREGRTVERMEWGSRGLCWGRGGVLHHKSHPEGKHCMTPPPSSIQPSLLCVQNLLSLPLSLSSLLLLLSFSPLPFSLCIESALWMDQVYFILLQQSNFCSAHSVFIHRFG